MAYTPTQPPSNPAALPTYLQNEFQKISRALVSPQTSVNLSPQAVLPAKVQDGMTAYFAAGVVGTGSAAGLYQYRANAWTLVG